MKTANLKLLKFAIIVLLPCITVTTVSAQKLPSVQKDPLMAPADVKTDGKPTEWDKFQAYNKSTEVYYTIANNAENLYLTLQATNPDIIETILAGGITFTVKNTDKKNTVPPVAITYPLLPGKSRSGITSRLKDEGPISDADLAALNKQILDNLKEIRVTGVQEFPDSALSVYNDQGIKTMGRIDDKKAYTYELAISLKYLRQVIGSAGIFNYSIKLNGMNAKIMSVTINGLSRDPGSPEAANLINAISVAPGGTFQNLTNPTDFSGTYTLAKK